MLLNFFLHTRKIIWQGEKCEPLITHKVEYNIPEVENYLNFYLYSHLED
jgi:hypothetical protein